MRASYVGQVTRMLWLGFEETAYAALQDLTTDARPANVRIAALTEIARWHATYNRPDASIEAIDQAMSLLTDEEPPAETRALAIDLFTPAGRREQVYRLLDEAPEEFRVSSDGLLRRVNAMVTLDPPGQPLQDAAVDLVSSLFTRRNCTPISLVDDSAGIALGNVRGTAQVARTRSSRMVSVIMPVWNAADTIGYALRGLLEQTWSALEIVVVDDGSTDGTMDVVAGCDDPRIRIERNPGKGTYSARNFGLLCSRGEFVTVHDADDWSHPEKIEQQVRPLLGDDSLIGTQSACARTSPTLYFVEPSLRPRRVKVIPNTSSFLMRRMAFDVLGPWDTPSVSADNELIERCSRFYGPTSVRSVLDDVPLSFALRSATSLTSAAIGTGVLSLQHFAGARRLYRNEYVRWHRQEGFAASLPLDPDTQPRSFVRPRLLEPRVTGDDHLDVVIMGDFTLEGSSTRSTVQEVRTQRDAGLRTGLLHVPGYEAEFQRYRDPLVTPLGPLDEQLLALNDGVSVRLLAAGETVYTDLLIVRPPQTLQEPVVGLPVVHANHTVVVVDTTPLAAFGEQSRRLYDPAQCVETLRAMGHSRVTWYPSTPAMRSELVVHHHREFARITLASDDWGKQVADGHGFDHQFSPERHIHRIRMLARTRLDDPRILT